MGVDVDNAVDLTSETLVVLHARLDAAFENAFKLGGPANFSVPAARAVQVKEEEPPPPPDVEGERVPLPEQPSAFPITLFFMKGTHRDFPATMTSLDAAGQASLVYSAGERKVMAYKTVRAIAVQIVHAGDGGSAPPAAAQPAAPTPSAGPSAADLMAQEKEEEATRFAKEKEALELSVKPQSEGDLLALHGRLSDCLKEGEQPEASAGSS